MNNTVLDEIVSIEEGDTIDTIDITVEGNHLFFANGILTHNSSYTEENPGLDKTGESIAIPQTADGLFTLWQTDAEKELGILNMGVRKNRFGPNFGKRAFKIDYDTLSIDEMEDVFNETDNIKRTDDLLEKLGSS